MQMFDGYVGEDLVAEGAAATVWRAMQPELGRPVAIEALTPLFSANKSAVDQLGSEARRLTELDSPHIVAVYDFVEDAQRAYLVTEWIEGETLRDADAAQNAELPEQSLGVLRGGLSDGPGLRASAPARAR